MATPGFGPQNSRRRGRMGDNLIMEPIEGDGEPVSGAAGPLTWILASLAALLGLAPVLAYGGLVVHPYLIVPVSALSGGVLAGLAASWLRTASASWSSSRLLPVVGTTVAVALVVVPPLMIIGLMVMPVPVVLHVIPAVLILGGVAGWAAWRFRRPERRLVRDGLVSLGLLAAGVIVGGGALVGFCSTLLTCSA